MALVISTTKLRSGSRWHVSGVASLGKKTAHNLRCFQKAGLTKSGRSVSRYVFYVALAGSERVSLGGAYIKAKDSDARRAKATASGSQTQPIAIMPTTACLSANLVRKRSLAPIAPDITN